MKTKNAVNAVSAIIVTYYPDLDRLQRVVDSVVGQVDDLIIVDNGSPVMTCEAMKLAYQEKSTLLFLLENLGIACAQNRGIACARTHGASQILLL